MAADPGRRPSRGPCRDARRILDPDYDVYAAGEAELGWLNSSLRVTAPAPFALDHLASGIVRRLQQSLAASDAEPAHLKVIGSSDGSYAVANLVSSDTPAMLSLVSGCRTCRAEVVGGQTGTPSFARDHTLRMDHGPPLGGALWMNAVFRSCVFSQLAQIREAACPRFHPNFWSFPVKGCLSPFPVFWSHHASPCSRVRNCSAVRKCSSRRPPSDRTGPPWPTSADCRRKTRDAGQ